MENLNNNEKNILNAHYRFIEKPTSNYFRFKACENSYLEGGEIISCNGKSLFKTISNDMENLENLKSLENQLNIRELLNLIKNKMELKKSYSYYDYPIASLREVFKDTKRDLSLLSCCINLNLNKAIKSLKSKTKKDDVIVIGVNENKKFFIQDAIKKDKECFLKETLYKSDTNVIDFYKNFIVVVNAKLFKNILKAFKEFKCKTIDIYFMNQNKTIFFKKDNNEAYLMPIKAQIGDLEEK